MKTAEKVLLGLTILGGLLMMLRLPGAPVIMGVGCALLAGLYLFLNFPLLFDHPTKGLLKSPVYRQASANRKIGAAGFGYALCMVVLCVLLAFQGQASRNQLLMGVTFSAIAGAIAFTKRKSDSTDFYKRVLVRAAPAVAVGGLTLLLLSR